MSGVPPEYTIYIDSYNRDQSCDPLDPNNPTNHVTIPTKLPRQRTPLLQMHLGSFEMPLAQYTVEESFGTLYMDEGLDLIVNSTTDLPLREFTVSVNGTTYTAELPIYLNPVISVVLSDGGTTATLTTLFDHALDVRGAWTWNSMELISTNLGSTDQTQLTTDNSDLTIVDANTFRLENLPVVTWTSTSGVFGYVHAPTIPGADSLALVVQAALNLVAPNLFQVSYNANTGLFGLTYLGTTDTCTSNPPVASDTVLLTIQGQNSLSALMGFGKGVGQVPVPTPGSGCIVDPNCTDYTLYGSLGFQCLTKVQIKPGNYDATGLGAQLIRQTNRFYFSVSTTLVFAEETSTERTVTIDPGMYTPDTLAEYLEDEFNSLDTTGAVYQVSYDPDTGLFCFEADNPFSLLFSNSGTTFNAAVLGFSQIDYLNSTEFCSSDPFQVPTKGCCGTNIPERYLSNLYNPVINSSTSEYDLIASTLPCISPGVLTDLGNGFGRVNFTTANVAHGFQPEDVIVIRDSVNVERTVRVTNVVDAFIFDFDFGSVNTLTPGNVSVCPDRLPVWNLYFSRQNNNARPNQMPGRFWGFPNTDIFWSSGTNAGFLMGNTNFKSLYCADLGTPNYVLIVIDEPHGATHNNHAWDESNIPNVFAKVILYPQYRLERIFPMNMYLPQVTTITQLKIRILNPDHTLYQFHGKNWSASLVLTTQEDTSLKLTCY